MAAGSSTGTKDVNLEAGADAARLAERRAVAVAVGVLHGTGGNRAGADGRAAEPPAREGAAGDRHRARGDVDILDSPRLADVELGAGPGEDQAPGRDAGARR